MKESKIYLAASYPRKEEMKGYRDVIVREGYTVTSRWIDQDGQHEKGDLPPDRYMSTPDECFAFAERDMEDIANSNVFILFTGDALGSGGRHTEFGMAFNYRNIEVMIVIGPRENVFQCSPGIVQFDTFDEFWKTIEQGRAIAESRRRIDEQIRSILSIPSTIYGWESSADSNPIDAEEIGLDHQHVIIGIAEDGDHIIVLSHSEGEDKENGSK